MPSRPHSFFLNIGALAFVVGAGFLLLHPDLDQYNTSMVATSTVETAATNAPFATPTSTTQSISPTAPSIAPTSSATKITKVALIKSAKPTTTPSAAKQPATATSSVAQAERIQDPYDFPAESSDTINAAARGALVNILCMPRGGGSLQPISGSGVIIDPRGVILTNAHVAQYLLLSESPDINLECQIRTGSPATAQWSASVIYIPPVWVNQHAADINTAHPTGTGEHDYALLLITGSLSNSSLPATFPSIYPDTRDGIGFVGDQVLGASYPAEFLGGMAAENDLYPVSSVSPIDQLLTFGTNTVDVISIGGVIEAQSGSSGGPVVNAWGWLVGIIATTSDAPTTAGRDLRAVTLSYINRDILAQTGSGLEKFVEGDLAAKVKDFNTNTAPGLISQYIKILSQ